MVYYRPTTKSILESELRENRVELKVEKPVFKADKEREEFNRDMVNLTKGRHLVNEHNRLIISQYWHDKCDAGQNSVLQICIDGPPKVVP